MKLSLIGKRVRTRSHVEHLASGGGVARLHEPAAGTVIDVAPGPGWRVLVELDAPAPLKGVLVAFGYDDLAVQPAIARPSMLDALDD